jgi:microcystin-dependent protein
MANLPETATWDAGVYQLETTDPVLGGPNGTSNVPLKNLANRTAYLKAKSEALDAAKAPLESPALTGTPTAPTAAAGTNTTQLANTAFVKTAVASAVSGLVTSVAGKTGAVTLAVADISGAAPLASPALTGTPTAPTPAAGSNTMQIATTAFVTSAIAAAPAAVSSVAGKTGVVTLAVADISGAAPLASPALTGTPTAPTPTAGDSTTKLATTAFVSAAIVTANSTMVTNAAPAAETVGATAAVGTATTAARSDHRHAMPDEASTSSAGFMSAADKTKLNGIQAGAQANTVTSVAGKTGAVTLAVADISGAAPLASPALTGTPTAPTPILGDHTTKVATTQFVGIAVAEATPAGMVAHFACNSAPAGWLKANGAAVSRTTYAALFSAIGTTFGSGDGSTTFNLPDLRGEFIRGWDDGRGVDSGRAFASSQQSRMQDHYHGTGDFTKETNDDWFAIVRNWTGTYTGRWVTGDSGTNNTTSVNGGSGGTRYTGTTDQMLVGGTETHPRNVALLACIKY